MAVCVTAFCVSAADRIWTGGGDDANWSTPENWGGMELAEGDRLFFSGAARLASTNDLPDGTAFAGITFSGDAGAFTLGGNRIALGGSVENLAASAQTVNIAVSLPYAIYFNASNGAITVGGTLSGAGGLTKIGPYPLTLASSNSYDGVTTVNQGMLWITHSHALGSTNGNTIVNSMTKGGFLQLSGDITVPEPLTLNGQCPTGGGAGGSLSSMFNAGGTNIWSGPITRKSGGNNTRIHLKSGSRLNITGGVTGSGSQLFVMRMDTGTIAFSGKPINIGSDRMWIEQSGTVILGATNNVWGANPNFDGNNILRMEVADALAPETAVAMGFSATGSFTLDLNGFDQRIGKIFSPLCTSGNRIITTPTPATLTVDQSEDTHLDARLNGQLTLVKAGTGMLTLSNSVANLATTTGSIIVSNGTLRAAAPNCFGNAANVTVAGGTLSLQSAETIKDTASLSITNSGAQVNISDGLMETVEKLFINNMQQANGTWGTAASGATHQDDTLFSGTGKIYVLTGPSFTVVDATWDAGGADTLLSTAANWTGDALPAFDGTTHAFFGEGGATATVDTAASLYGLTFNATNDFTVDSGAGTLTLGAGGVTAAIPDTTSRAYTLTADTTLSANQPWTVTTNQAGVTTLAVEGAVRNGNDPFGITKTGNGILVLSGDNSYDGTTYVNEGTLTIAHDNALGSTSGATIIADGAWMEMKGGITVAEAVTLPSDPSTRNAGGLRVTGGSNVWSGKITSSMANSRITCNGGSLDIIGGIGGGQMCLGGAGGSYIRVSEKPINTPGFTFFAHTSIPIILAVTNNVWNDCQINGNFVRTDMENVLPAAAGLTLGSVSYSINPSGINLNGHNQTVGQLKTYDVGSVLILCSPTPAKLTVEQTASTMFHASITGAVTLVKSGSGALTLTRACATSGDFVVSNGTLAVSADGALGVNSTNIVVAGGTLSLSNSSAVSDSATLVIADGGGAKVDLAAGVNESVGWLYFGGRPQRAGTYSAAAGGGVLKVDTEHFAGTGILTVLHDSAGTLIRLR